MSPDDSTAYVTNSWDNTVSVVDLVIGRQVGLIPVGGYPMGIALSRDGRRAYVACDEGGLDVLDVVNRVPIASLAIGTHPRHVAVDPSGAYAYVTWGDSPGYVAVIDTAGLTRVADIAVGDIPQGICISGDGSTIYTANAGSGTCSVVDTVARAVIAIVDLGGGYPQGACIQPDGSRVYITHYYGSRVSVIGTASRSLLTTIPTAATPACCGVTADGAYLYVGHADSRVVRVLDTGSYSLLGEVGCGPIFGLGFTSDSRCAYASDHDRGALWVLGATEPAYPRQVSIPSVWGTPGLALAVPVYVTPVRDVGGIQIDLRYDPNLLTPVDVTPGELISSLPGWEIATRFDPGRAQAIVYNSLATPVYGGSGPIMYVNFLVNPAAANGASCALDLANVILADGSGNALPIDAVWDGLFTVSALHHFAFDTIPSPQGADPVNPLPFPVHIRALDESDQLCVAYSNAVDLSDLLVGALGAAHFASGEWSGQIALHSLTGRLANVITATDATLGVSGNSNAFDVIVKGSVNGDQTVNVLDVMKTVNIILGYITPPEWQYWAADLNNDGEVNVQDIILIINKIFDASALMRPAGVAALAASSARASAEPVVVDAEWGKSPAGNPVLAITLSNAAGVAGAQVDVTYDAKRVKGVTARVGALIASNSGWSVYSNGASGKVRALAFSGSAQGLAASKGSIIELEFTANAKGNLGDIAAVTLTDSSGSAIPTRIPGAGKPGHK